MEEDQKTSCNRYHLKTGKDKLSEIRGKEQTEQGSKGACNHGVKANDPTQTIEHQ